MLEACSQTEVLSEAEDDDDDNDDNDEASDAADGGGGGMRQLRRRLRRQHEDRPEYLMSSPRVTAVARRELAVAIRDLMQHGLVQVGCSIGR